MGKINSKTKGKVAELELVKKFKEHGIETARRSAQFHGNTPEGSPDVLGVAGIHVESKRTERLQLYDALKQAVRDSEKQENGIPVVFHRKNREDWVAIMRFDDWIEMWKALNDIHYWDKERKNK